MSLRVRLFVSHVLVTIVSLIALTLTIMLLLTEFQRGLMLRELSNVGNNLWRLTRNAPAQSPPDQPQGFFERATRTNRDNGLRVLVDESLAQDAHAQWARRHGFGYYLV